MIETDSRLMDALYQGTTDVAEFERAITMLAERLSCRSAVLLSLNAQMPATDVSLTTGAFDAAATARYLADFAAIDPAPAAIARLPVGRASTTDRILPENELRNGVFVNEFYRPLGLAETLGGNLSASKGRFELIGLHRGTERPAFEDDEIAAIERLMPHITRALQLRRAFFRLQTKVAGLEDALDRLEAGVILLDADGTASFVNGAMREIAQRRDGISLDRAGRPLPTEMNARNRLDALIASASAGGSGGVMAVPGQTSLRPYAVLVAPTPSTLRNELADGDAAGVLVLVHDPARATIAPPEILQRGLDLSPSTARLVSALAAEDDLKSFAAREGITIHTARYHLRTALARTGTRTQADLVRIAVRLLRDFALRREH